MIDTVIIGAGPSGLCAAKTILQCNSNAEVVILESGSSIGGVWAKEKIYSTLKTNHHFGGMDFSDFPMPVAHGAQPGDHIPGMAVHEFLRSYAHHFGLQRLIRFCTTVTEIVRLETGGWRLTLSTPSLGTLECNKLIVAMGVNNQPYRPILQGISEFGGPVIHSAELGSNTERLFGKGLKKTIAVIGGGKSAYDAVNMASTAGNEVEWIMRKSGKGPVWVFPMETKIGPFEVLRDKMPVTRFVTFFSPCIWDDGFKWLRNLLHTTKFGNFIRGLFWAKMHASTIHDCDYRSDSRTRVLEPEQSPFWYGTTGGSSRYVPEIFQRIRQGQIRVHREDISYLSRHSIHLANGHTVRADAIITATGFTVKSTMNFVPSRSHSDLGLPTADMNLDQQKFWASLDLLSDTKLSQRFPQMMKGPSLESLATRNTPPSCSPFRLFRSLAPPGLTAAGDRSLIFMGVFSNFANHTRLEIQCLWAYAYLNNKLDIDPRGAFEEASLMSRYSMYRTPYGHGHYFPDHVFDQLPYFDVLMRDLGLPSRRKSSWFKELFEPYHVTDYAGIVQEWLTTNCKA